MFSIGSLILEQLYMQMKDMNEKAVNKIEDLVLYIKNYIKEQSSQYKNLSFEQFVVAAFRGKNEQRIQSLYALKKALTLKGYNAKVVDSIPSAHGYEQKIPGLYFGKLPVYDEEKQEEKTVDIYFTIEFGLALAYTFAEEGILVICPEIFFKSTHDINGLLYHEMIHLTQPTKKMPRRYVKSRAINPRPGRVGLQDYFDYIRAKIEFEAALGGVIQSLRRNFKTLYNKAPNDQLWQRTRDIQLSKLKTLTELDRKAVLKEFSINYTQENHMPFENSIIPFDEQILLQTIYFASLGDEKTSTGNVGRLRWNQLINGFKALYNELSQSEDYATK